MSPTRDHTKCSYFKKKKKGKGKRASYLKIRWDGDAGRWRRFKYPLPPPLLLPALWWFSWFEFGSLLVLLLLRSDLTTRRSIREEEVGRWAGPGPDGLLILLLWSLAWYFMQRSLFLFPHCNTKSDDVVAAADLDSDLNNSPSLLAEWPLFLSILLLCTPVNRQITLLVVINGG